MKAFHFKSLAIGSKGIVAIKSIAVVAGISAATFGIVKIQEFNSAEKAVVTQSQTIKSSNQYANLSSAGFVLELDKLFNSFDVEDEYVSNQESAINLDLSKTNDQASNNRNVKVLNTEPKIFSPLVITKPAVKEEAKVGFEFTKEDLSYFEKFGTSRTIVPAFYEGGNEKLSDFVSTSIMYPKDAMELGIEGTVCVQFEINSEGEIENVKTVKGVYKSLDNEAERIVRLLPNWKPKQVNMENVPSLVQIPIKFDIQ